MRARRLGRHHLLTRAAAGDLVAVTHGSCGIHAQLQPAAELALAIRVDGIRRDDVRDAIWERRSLVRMSSLRGTIHLLPAADAPVWLAARRAGHDQRAEARRVAALGLDEARMAAMVAAIGDALDGRRLTLRELAPEVARRAGDWVLEGAHSAFGGAWPHWRAALGPPSMAIAPGITHVQIRTLGLFCNGP